MPGFTLNSIRSGPMHTLPVAGGLFAGRADLIAQTRRDSVILFTGRRHVGKSSLLNQIAHVRSSEPGTVVAFLSVVDRFAEVWAEGAVVWERGFLEEPPASDWREWFREKRVELGEQAVVRAARTRILLLDEPADLDSRGLVQDLGLLAAAVATQRSEWHGLFVADHLELEDQLKRFDTGSRALHFLGRSRVPLAPLTREELGEALELRGLERMHEAVWYWSGGHPWYVGDIAAVFGQRSSRTSASEVTRLWQNNGMDTDAAVGTWTSRHGITFPPLETDLATRRMLAGVLYPHLHGKPWPALDEEPSAVVSKIVAYQLSDDTNLGSVAGSQRYLRDIARGRLPCPLAPKHQALGEELAQYTYLQLSGSPGAEGRLVYPTDQLALFRWVHYPEPGKEVQAPPAPVDSWFERVEVCTVGRGRRGLRWTIDDATVEISPSPSACAAVLAVAGATSIHGGALDAALRTFDPGGNTFTRLVSEARRAVEEAYTAHLREAGLAEASAAGAARARVRASFPLQSQGHLVLRARKVSYGETVERRRLRLGGPTSPEDEASIRDLTLAWHAFLRESVPSALPREHLLSVMGESAAVVVAGEGEAYFAVAHPDRPNGWSASRIKVLRGEIRDENPKGSTLWSPAAREKVIVAVREELLGARHLPTIR